MKISRSEGFDFIQSQFGVFSDEMKKYNSLRGAKAVDYLVSLGYTADRSTWLWVTFTPEFYK